uniref:glucuronosyltransferase n=1 Tax=Steinernema glaseri TaxID=37863 RepID=A0A1I8AWB3_9BILA
MNSILESAHRGVPIISVPLFADQARNAKMMTRLGSGIDISRFDLGDVEKFSSSIKKVLTEEKYAATAKRVAFMIKNRPMNQTDVFVKHVEFAAQFGAVPAMTSLEINMSFIEYYMLDAIALVISGILILFVLVCWTLKYCGQFIRERLLQKQKQKTQ